MATVHINAETKDIAKTVLMPGDPLRAKFIAENYLENPKLFNTVRNMFGFSGTYKGEKISVMGSGMGMPSIGIYSYELFSQFSVENIIRIGSAGAYVPELNLNDIVLAEKSFSESTYAKVQFGFDGKIMLPSQKLNEVIRKTAEDINQPLHLGCVNSSDVFYAENSGGFMKFVTDFNCCCVEMESFALFSNAVILGKNAACLLTVSDSLLTKKEISADARQNSFNKMMLLALEAAIKL